MTDIRTPRRRRGLGFVRGMALATVAAAALALGNSGAASAAIDGSNSVVDFNGNRIEAITADTFIQFVPPLDGNPLTREWFHNGRAAFKVEGPDAEDFEGTITIGYQVGYPATFDGSINFGWNPEVEIEVGGDSITPTIGDIIPLPGFDMEVGFGPGIVDVPAAEGDISGTEGDIALSNFQGTVTGVLGVTSIRPYVKVVSAAGDTVVAYGPIFRN
ncbi:MspA family porin [Antrihabitans spumae]|uniref:MspA family porin n=1 Tax=Antrihabitans spumae TaxID=3373370 RepID=A0ABW7KDJ0_9NOCA